MARSFGRRYAELETVPLKLALYGRRALAKDVGVAPEGRGSHRIALGAEAGAFTDPDGFAWSGPAQPSRDRRWPPERQGRRDFRRGWGLIPSSRLRGARSRPHDVLRATALRAAAIALALSALAAPAAPAATGGTGETVPPTTPAPARRRAGPGTKPPVEAVTIGLNPVLAGRPVPARFLGLSFEVGSLGLLAQMGEHGNLVTLLRSLGPGVLRFGGITADQNVAWSDAATPRPAWASATIGPADMRSLGRLARRSGWTVLLTVGLAHFEPQAAAREVAAAKAALGPRLVGVEIGNEPDSLGRHGYRLMPWLAQGYEEEVSEYREAIGRSSRACRSRVRTCPARARSPNGGETRSSRRTRRC